MPHIAPPAPSSCPGATEGSRRWVCQGLEGSTLKIQPQSSNQERKPDFVEIQANTYKMCFYKETSIMHDPHIPHCADLSTNGTSNIKKDQEEEQVFRAHLT
jgi:hypothetical protein